MGGTGSGRPAKRQTVESSLSLDVSRMLRQGALVKGERRRGSYAWETASGRAAVDYESSLAEEDGLLHLTYEVTAWDGPKRRVDYFVHLVARPQPLGGVRWWFICPLTGAHAQKLYKPPGRLKFGSQRGHGLTYASQRTGPEGRATHRMFKLRKRLGTGGGLGDAIYKPPWMRWRTFDRIADQIEECEARIGASLAAFIDKKWNVLRSM